MAAALLGAGPLAGQRADVVRGSRYVATTDWMTEVASRLRMRGLLASLNPLAQPWTRDEVARAVARVAPEALDTMPRQVSHALRLLREELGPELLRLAGMDSLAMGFSAHGGVIAATNPRIDPYLPLRTGQPAANGAPRDPRFMWQDHGAGGWAERGAIAADLQVGWDYAQRRADPGGIDPKRIFDALPDNQVAYVSLQFRDGGFDFGRLRRNWAPVGSKGLMLSDSPLGIPQIGYHFGGRNVQVRGFVGELDTLAAQERYVAAHRIEYLRENFALSLGELKVYASSGGPRLTTFNPVEVFFITGDKLGGEVLTNTSLNGQIWMRRGALTLAGETFVDDMWVAHRAPPRVAFSAAADYAGLPSGIELGVAYRLVYSFTYWTPDSHQGVDHLEYYGRGLGDNDSDYDRLAVHANLYPNVAGLRLTPTIALQRKGEWDFHSSLLADTLWLARPGFLQGVQERTVRIALAGRYQPTRRVFAEWDAGMNLVKNVDHVVGAGRSEFSAMLRVSAMWSTPTRRAP